MCCFSLSVWQMCESGHTRTDFSNDQLKTEINVLLLQSFFFDLVRKKHLVSFEKKRSRGSPQGRQLWWVIATSPFGGTFPSGVTSQTCERERGKSNRKKKNKKKLKDVRFLSNKDALSEKRSRFRLFHGRGLFYLNSIWRSNQNHILSEWQRIFLHLFIAISALRLIIHTTRFSFSFMCVVPTWLVFSFREAIGPERPDLTKWITERIDVVFRHQFVITAQSHD